MATTEESLNGARNTSIARLQISEDLKKNTKGAFKDAVEALSLAASMTQNGPYLGIVSSALTELLKIQDEVTAYRSDWKAVMAIAQQLKAIVDKVREHCKTATTGDEALPEALKDPFDELERCIAKTLEVLNACTIQPSDRHSASLTRKIKIVAREYLNRESLAGDVKQCRADMQTALDLFSTKLQIDQALEMYAMKIILLGLQDRQPASQGHLSVTPVIPSLPAAPAIFYGRSYEVDQVVDTVLHNGVARVAVLGFGGIGKTSIALTVMHRPEIEERYGVRRFSFRARLSIRPRIFPEGF